VLKNLAAEKCNFFSHLQLPAAGILLNKRLAKCVRPGVQHLQGNVTEDERCFVSIYCLHGGKKTPAPYIRDFKPAGGRAIVPGALISKGGRTIAVSAGNFRSRQANMIVGRLRTGAKCYTHPIQHGNNSHNIQHHMQPAKIKELPH